MTPPEPYQQTPATTAGQRATAQDAAASFLADIDAIEQKMRDADAEIAAEQTPRIPTFYKDLSKPPAIGTMPPVQQPGRTAMSQKATDDSVRMLSFGAMSILASAGAYLVMKGSEVADPTVIGCICAAPVGLAVPILAIGSLLRRTKEVVEAAPPQITQYYSGDVYQQHTEITTSTKGVIAHSRNDFFN